MSKEIFDVVVLGIGAMGSATLHELAKRGVNVCGVEQYEIAHDRGSSHGETRMIRKAYFEHPDYLPLLHRTYDLWETLQQNTGETLSIQNGLIVAGAPDSEVIKGLDLCYAEHDLPYEKLHTDAAQSRFPQFTFSDDQTIYYDPIAGILFPERCIETLVTLAQENGAIVYTGEKVLNWKSARSEIQITTDRREIITKKLILTAGPWAVEQLNNLNIQLAIWRKVMFWYHTPDLHRCQPDTLPSYYFETEDGGFYGFPAVSNSGMKMGEHGKPEPIPHPKTLNRHLERKDEPPVLNFARSTFRGFQLHRTKFSVCMYTVTPDHHFILDVHPENSNVVLAAGFSGHGFKFAPVVGEILADFATKSKTDYPVEFLRLSRFW